MNKIFYKMIHELDDEIHLNVDPTQTFILTFYKHFNDIGYSISVLDIYNKPIYKNSYHRPEFETLHDIFVKSTIHVPSMTLTLLYNHDYQTFDLSETC